MQHFKISEKKIALLKGSTFKTPRFYHDYLFLCAIRSTLESDEKTDDIIHCFVVNLFYVLMSNVTFAITLLLGGSAVTAISRGSYQKNKTQGGLGALIERREYNCSYSDMPEVRSS